MCLLLEEVTWKMWAKDADKCQDHFIVSNEAGAQPCSRKSLDLGKTWKYKFLNFHRRSFWWSWHVDYRLFCTTSKELQVQSKVHMTATFNQDHGKLWSGQQLYFADTIMALTEKEGWGSMKVEGSSSHW